MPTVDELHTLLSNRGLPTDGRKAELEQRLNDAERRENKRARTTVNSVADEWLCPITRELPTDPVLAEDNKTYERAAISNWLVKKRSSPTTGAAMGTRLVSAPQVRNTIEKLVESGLVDADRTTVWKKKIDDERLLKKVRREADQGDGKAMHILGLIYKNGEKGLAPDVNQARDWFEPATELGHVAAMAIFGQYLLQGVGGPSVPALGLFYTGRAAERGSDLATYMLGKAFLNGHYGLPQNSLQAKCHFRRVVDGECEVKDLAEMGHDRAKQYLEELS